MMDAFREAALALGHTLDHSAGQSLIVRRGSEAIEVRGTVGATLFEQTDESGTISRFEARDFLIAVSAYRFAGLLAIPRKGDQILETTVVDGRPVDRVYQVQSPDRSQQPFRYSDTSQTRFRIHTVEVPR